jgi:hypothetical protein
MAQGPRCMHTHGRFWWPACLHEDTLQRVVAAVEMLMLARKVKAAESCRRGVWRCGAAGSAAARCRDATWGWMRSLTASSGTKLQGITEHRAAPEQEQRGGRGRPGRAQHKTGRREHAHGHANKQEAAGCRRAARQLGAEQLGRVRLHAEADGLD